MARFSLWSLMVLAMLSVAAPAGAASPSGLGEMTLSGSGDVLRIALILTLLAVIPALFVSMTSFIRIIIVLAMVRHAFGMPETPPNQVLISLALFLTLFSMGSTFTALNDEAIQPFLSGQSDVATVIERGSDPLRDYMLRQVRDRDLETIYAIAEEPLPATPEEVSLLKLTPAFILNELRVAFMIGFVILLPFLLIDLVVSSVLLSLGMMMVPPATISLPIKVLMFVLIDGWALVLEGVLGSFR